MAEQLACSHNVESLGPDMTIRFHDHRGRRYRVVARFAGDDRAEQSAAYIRTHTHVRLLCDEGDEAIVVADRDFGTALDNVDSGFDAAGWSSFLFPPTGS